MPSLQGKRWCFTLNNPTEDEEQELANKAGEVKYLIFGRERGENGTPHLQGFVIFNSNQRLRAVRVFIRRAHWELARGTNQEAADYCKKDGEFDEFGELPVDRSGRRTDLEEIIAWGDEFERNNGRPPTSPEVAKEQPQAYVRYPRMVRLFQARASAVRLREGTPLPWQQELETELSVPPDDRTVRFFVDLEGGKGKTWFQQYYMTKFPNEVQVLSIGKRDDLAHVIDETKTVFFFNIPRGGMEYFQYPIAESLKDRMVFSPKYMSRMKFLRHNCHVIVFCNEAPDETKLSEGRAQIKYL